MRHAALINGIIGLLTLFVLTGVALTFKSMLDASARTRRARTGIGRRSMRQRVREYVGPIDRSQAPLRGARSVLVEFVVAMTGFPGLGWLLSGRIFPGLVLLSVVPAFVWGFVPVALSLSGLLLLSPYSVIVYLPILAIASAGALAAAEVRAVRAEAHAA